MRCLTTLPNPIHPWRYLLHAGTPIILVAALLCLAKAARAQEPQPPDDSRPVDLLDQRSGSVPRGSGDPNPPTNGDETVGWETADLLRMALAHYRHDGWGEAIEYEADGPDRNRGRWTYKLDRRNRKIILVYHLKPGESPPADQPQIETVASAPPGSAPPTNARETNAPETAPSGTMPASDAKLYKITADGVAQSQPIYMKWTADDHGAKAVDATPPPPGEDPLGPTLVLTFVRDANGEYVSKNDPNLLKILRAMAETFTLGLDGTAGSADSLRGVEIRVTPVGEDKLNISVAVTLNLVKGQVQVGSGETQVKQTLTATAVH